MKINFKSLNYKQIVLSLAIIAGFAILSLIYFQPILEGKSLRQFDVMQYQGMSKEAKDYEQETGETQLWTNGAFGGMPTYLIQIATDNMVTHIHHIFHTTYTHPQMFAIMYFVCFFLALLLMDVPIWLAMLGALFYGFSSYFYIILEAGHMTKAAALGYMPLVIASVYATFQPKKMWLGAALFALTLALQLIVNHPQITYYTAFICLTLVCCKLYETIKAKDSFFKQFIKPSLLLLVGIMLALGANFCNLYMIFDYGKDSMRGKSELTDHTNNKTSGLDKDYATAWSYGIDETINLLVPNFKGGASNGELSKESETYKTLKQYGVPNVNNIIKGMPTYWGEQPITSGPVYIGAIVIFLFIFGLLYVTGPFKWGIAIISAMSIVLAWGHNFIFLSDFFLDYFPGYNKFRTVSMILVIVEYTMPLLAIFAVKKFMEEKDKAAAFKKLGIAFGIVAGFLLLCIFTAGMWSFQGLHDKEILPEWLLPSLIADRKAMMTSDLWRSLLIVSATFVVLTIYRFDKMKAMPAIMVLATITIIDLWPVNKRYLNDDDFSKTTKNVFRPTEADLQILQDTALDYRVINFTVSPFNDASTSYFHKSLGGYHGAKMRRYQELIDSCLSKNNMQVYNMLNTKYFIVPDENQTPTARLNPGALGNAWFVKAVHMVPNADAEIGALKTFDPAQEAIVDKRFTISDTTFARDSSASIKLDSYAPMEMHYTSNNAYKSLAIFSEIYYEKGWNAYIDGKLMPHFRANYILRGLEIPAGKHEIVFKFEPQQYFWANKISLIVSSLLLLGVFVILVLEIRKFLLRQNNEVA